VQCGDDVTGPVGDQRAQVGRGGGRLLGVGLSCEGGEACVCDLNDAFDLSRPTVGHHVKVLYEAGLVDRDKRGVWVHYRARPQALAALGALIGCPPR
jgi:ArsR family transcriptional regulator, arsenate/arsenite/antimonite-responsive transcriptional repressor